MFSLSAAAICASHTPLMDEGPVDTQTRRDIDLAFGRLAAWVRDFAPDYIVQFSPDHFNGFFYDLMPSFCVGVGASSVGDWATKSGPLPVPEDIALAVLSAAREADFDPAVSYRMQVDHGFVQIWEKMFGRFDLYPIVPVFVNCAAPPLPTYRRARLFGEAVGRFTAKSGKRILFAASGGLSHDPPVPEIATAEGETRERLIAGRNPSVEARQARQARVIAAAKAADQGQGPAKPLDPEWDQAFIDLILEGRLTDADQFTEESVRARAGRGGNEVLAWIAAFAALSVSGPYHACLEYYKPIHGWIAGMAMMTANCSLSGH